MTKVNNSNGSSTFHRTLWTWTSFHKISKSLGKTKVTCASHDLKPSLHRYGVLISRQNPINNPRAIMVAPKLFLRPHSLPLFTLHSKLLFPKLPSFPILSLSFSTTSIPDPDLSYGPSLHKGTKPPLPISPIEQPLIDEQAFTRIFTIAALRVPSKDCFALESRLRGHLLNWPRVRNIGRVPGDEVDDDLAVLFANNNNNEDDQNAVVSVNRRVYGKSDGDGEPLNAVEYRDKLAKTFDSRGYVNFRNLAKISRPNQKKRRVAEEDGSGGGRKRDRKGEFSVLEVVEDEDEGEDLKGLLGDEFQGRKKWRGSTRLLLLDETYGEKGVEELPQAVQV